MPQTSLALLAMMLASLFAMQQQRQIAHQQLRMIRNEVAMQGTGVAEDVLGEIGTKSFDENVKNEGQKAGSSSALTPEADFGTGSGESSAIDDIDDFDGNPNEEYGERLLGADTLRFGIEVNIAYVEDDLETEASSPTKAKKATVRVWSLDVRAPDTIAVARSFTCGSRCTW